MAKSRKPQPAVRGFLYSDGLMTINSKQYRCTSFKALSVVNELPVIQLVLSPLTKEQAAASSVNDIPERYKEMYDELNVVPLGTALEVSYKFTGNTKSDSTEPTVGQPRRGVRTVVFRGVLTGWAPIWMTNTMQFTVWASSDFTFLNWSSSRLDKIHGLGANDMTLPSIITKDDELVPFMRGTYDESVVNQDIWKQLLKKELIALSKMDTNGLVNMEKAVEMLENKDLDSSPFEIALNTPDPLSVIINMREMLMGSRYGRGTLWERLRKILVQYKLSIIFRLTDYMVLPVTHTLNAQPEVEFLFTDFQTVNRYNAVVRTLIESTNLIVDNSAFTGFFDTINKAQVGSAVMVNEDRRGHHVGPFPPWLSHMWSPLSMTSKTMGLDADKLHVPGYLMKDPETSASETSVNLLYNESSKNSIYQDYAETVLNQKAFQNVGILKGGISFDISPGSLMKAEMSVYRLPNETEYSNFYGMAWAVCVIMDGTPKTGTWVALRNVRGEDEQRSIPWTEHPLYKKTFIRAPFNPIPDITHDIELGGS